MTVEPPRTWAPTWIVYVMASPGAGGLGTDERLRGTLRPTAMPTASSAKSPLPFMASTLITTGGAAVGVVTFFEKVVPLRWGLAAAPNKGGPAGLGLVAHEVLHP